ncbi:MAG TPA: serine hydrolase domain-containing protein [Gemmatimonadaceae bacterium]|nr:serine hydrolase domain-containing protein [Gemmatimonadaceae bacterium]
MPSLTVLRSALTILALLAASATAAAAQSEGAALVTKLDSLAGSGVLENRAVGIAAAVVRGNDTLLLKGYGKADVEWNIPMPADAMFEIGSITKQFTAVALLQLRDDGKLSLEDDITKWLPDFDTRGNRVTLRRLLDHTSGIKGLTEMPEFGNLVTNGRFPRDSAYALIKRYPFQFATGEAQIYNNSAFWLLGLVVEKASGMTYEEYVEKKLFEPLGMRRSMYCNSSENVERRAHGYGVQNGVIRRAPTNVHTWPFAAGSLCSTAGDLVTWLTALHGGKVLSPKSYAEMITPSKLNDGTPLRYGMGIAVGKDVRGLNFIGHGGSITGFTAEAAWYPDAQAAIVVLMNSTGNIDPGAVAGELAAELLPWTRPTLTPFSGDAAPLLGKYQGPSRGRDMVVEVTQTAQGIAFSANGSPARPLPWVDAWTFRQGNAFLTFRRSGSSGPATELRFDAGSGYYILKRQ